MTDPVLTPAVDVPAPADANARIEGRLNYIDHCLEKIAEHQDIPLSDDPVTPNATNKPLLAAAFGFAGLKLGIFTIGKFGLAVDLVNAYGRNKMGGLTDAIQAFFNAADKEKGISKNLPFMFAGGIIGATAGAIGGTLLGWNRGDRLRNAGELFTHPIDSMRKIFSNRASASDAAAMPAPVAALEDPSEKQMPAVVQTAQHEGTVIAEPLKANQR